MVWLIGGGGPPSIGGSETGGGGGLFFGVLHPTSELNDAVVNVSIKP